MIHIDAVKLNLPLKKKFAVSGGSTESKVNVLTVLNNRYFGEAAASVKYGPTLEVIQADLKRGITLLSAHETFNHETLSEIETFDIHPVSRAALMGMVLHYLSGETKRYPWEVLSLPTPVGVRSSMTIGLDDPISMIDAIKQTEYPIVKIKMGAEYDSAVIDALQKVAGKEIRVDANGGWDLAKAEEMIFYLSKSGVKIIEQPTSPEFVSEWPRLKGKAEHIELIIDEGLGTADDYARVKEHVDGVNIKMEKSGGILQAILIAEQAKLDGKKVMLGCMVESSVGISQSLYMSALADYYDLDGPQLLERDIALGITYDRESIHVDREIIGGPRLLRDVVDKYIQE